MDNDKFNAWILRTFGSQEAYAKSLPARVWVQGDHGWHSKPR